MSVFGTSGRRGGEKKRGFFLKKQLRTEGPALTTRRTSLLPNEIQLIDNKRHQINFSRMLDFDEGKNLSDFNRGGV